MPVQPDSDLLVNLNELVDVGYGIPAGENTWNELLSRLCRTLHFDGAALATHELAGRNGRIVHAVGLDSAITCLYNHKFSETNPYFWSDYPYFDDLIVTSQDLGQSLPLSETDFFRLILKPQGFSNSLVAVITREGDEITYFFVFRKDSEPDFGVRSRTVLECFLPHARKALHLATNLVIDRTSLAALQEIVDQLRVHVLLVDRDGHVHFISDNTREYLTAAGGLVLVGDKIGAECPPDNQKLLQLIKAVTGDDSDDDCLEGRTSLRRRKSDDPLFVYLLPLSREVSSGFAIDSKVAALIITEPGMTPLVRADALVEYFGLTGAEARIAVLAIRADEADEITRRAQISRNTLHSHLNRIYAKTGCRNRADLVRLAFSIPELMSQVNSLDVQHSLED